MRFRSTLLLLALAGCPDRPLGAIYPVQGKVETKDIPANPRRDVDILFLIDDSGSMKDEQDSLRANFGKLMGVLETLDGGMPNVHIGVTTSDLGQSALDGSVGTALFTDCKMHGDDGQLRTAPAINGRFIVDEDAGNGTRTRNYTGTLEDAFSAIANVGTAGCGMEQHLGAVERALENPTNAGFIRPDAYLAIVVIGDEDDCSLQHSGIFEGSSDGKLINFRCTKDGITCDDSPDLTQAGTRNSCHPNAAPQWVQPVDHYVQAVQALKTDPRDIVVAGILGPANPFEIKIDTAANEPVLGPSCHYGVDQTAYPAVRTATFLSSFPLNTNSSICNSDLSAGLVQVGAVLKSVFGDPCFEVNVADLDPVTPGLQPDCTVVDVKRVTGQPDEEIAVIGSCELTHGATPCWKIEEDAVRCSYTHTDPHLKLVIDRGGVVPASDIHVKAQCVTSEPSGSGVP